jgi:hypothetical protein
VKRGWRCVLGFHDWVTPESLKMGSRRYCRRCAVVEELVHDASGWSAGYWEQVKDEDTGK